MLQLLAGLFTVLAKLFFADGAVKL